MPWAIYTFLKLKPKSLSHVLLFGIPWTVAYQAPQSVGFSRQEYWSGVLFPSPGHLPDPGIEPGSPALQAEQASLKKVSTTAPLVSGWKSDTEETSKQKLKQREPPWK